MSPVRSLRSARCRSVPAWGRSPGADRAGGAGQQPLPGRRRCGCGTGSTACGTTRTSPGGTPGTGGPGSHRGQLGRRDPGHLQDGDERPGPRRISAHIVRLLLLSNPARRSWIDRHAIASPAIQDLPRARHAPRLLLLSAFSGPAAGRHPPPGRPGPAVAPFLLLITGDNRPVCPGGAPRQSHTSH